MCYGMASRVVFTFTIESLICGYHEYQLIWGVPAVGEELNCYRKLGNSHDPYAVKNAMPSVLTLWGPIP